MTVKEMAIKYYPTFWDKNRIDALLQANKITQEEYNEIIQSNQKTE